MGMAAHEIEKRIVAAIPDAKVEIRDLAGDGDHYAATVISESLPRQDPRAAAPDGQRRLRHRHGHGAALARAADQSAGLRPVRGLAFLLLVLAIAGTAAGVVRPGLFVLRGSGLPRPQPCAHGRAMGALGAGAPPGHGRRQGSVRSRAASSIEPETANWYDGSGLALDRANGKLLVGSRGEVAVHALGDLTEVEFVPESAGSVSAAGVSNAGVLGAILALFAIGSATSGHLGSGLFLTLGGRKWQVFGVDMEEAKLWMAELRQVAPQAVFKEPE